MQWLNYHHLLYFWTVAREGGLPRASAELRLAQSTLSGQIHRFEAAIGHKLFVRAGRRLELTEMGRVALRFADEIFTLGRELSDVLADRPVGGALRVTIGITDVVPKLVARRLIEPALRLGQPVCIICREDRPERLVAELASHEVDLVLTDGPVSPQGKIRIVSRLLGECDTVVLGASPLAARYGRRFPSCLDGAPLLLPTAGSGTREAFEAWLAASGVVPQIVGEFDDSALLNVFGQAGVGFFPAPSVIADEVKRQYQVKAFGRARTVRNSYYSLTVARRHEHLAVAAICDAARRFGRGPGAPGRRATPRVVTERTR